MKPSVPTRQIPSRIWIKVAWTFAYSTVWCAFSFYSYYFFAVKHRDLAGGSVATIFVLIGLRFMWTSVRMAMDAAKFGSISLTSSMPAHPGGVFKASLIFHDHIRDLHRIDAELHCIRHEYVWAVKRTTLVEAIERTMRGSFPVRTGGLDSRAEIRFAIPRDAPATDAPGERGGESRPAKIEGTVFYRWEVVVSAKAKGLDLERQFAVIVDPAPELPASTSQALDTIACESTERDSDAAGRARLGSSEMQVEPVKASPIWRIGFLGIVLLAPWVPWLFQPPDLTAGQPVPVKTEQSRPAVATQTVLWTQNTEGWVAPLPPMASNLGIAIRNVRAVRKDGSDHFSIDEILIEKNPGVPVVSYSDILVYIVYVPDDGNENRMVHEYNRLLANSSGTLTAERPAVRMPEIAVTVPPQDVKTGRVRLRAIVNASNNSTPFLRQSSKDIVVAPR